MKRSLLLGLTCLIVLVAGTALGAPPASAPHAAAVPAITAAPAAAALPADPAAPAVSAADLLAPVAGTVSPLDADSSLPCFAYGTCIPCEGEPFAKPCLVVTCGTHVTLNCGGCRVDCVPPGD